MTNNIAINNFLRGRFVVQVYGGYNTFLELGLADQLINTYTMNKYLCKLSFREIFYYFQGYYNKSSWAKISPQNSGVFVSDEREEKQVFQK